MITIDVADFASWRNSARTLIQRRVAPDGVLWVDAHGPQDALPFADRGDSEKAEESGGAADIRVPRRFVEQAEDAALHRSPDRWALLYRVLWRIQFENRALLDLVSDADVHALDRLAAQVRRDEHKMRAFVRFTPVRDARDEEDGQSDANASGEPRERYVAYYEPDHLIVRKAAPFFADRFSSMRWSILTPDLSAHWDTTRLTFGEGVPAPLRPRERERNQHGTDDEGDENGEIEQLWRTYYGAVFNPARLNLRATMREMPMRRWGGLPEAALIPSLVNSAHERVTALRRESSSQDSARPFVPEAADLAALREAAPACRGCELSARATQVVFGEGRADARLVLVGEQPGDAEDLVGRPFVGPAGQVLDRALAEAGIERDAVYVTNAVKHFSFEERGKRRIHKTPRSPEVRACRPWLEAELQALRPSCVVCLGATAAQSLLGPQARVMQQRGQVMTHTAWAPALIVTIHPSAVLRADDGESYYRMLVSDLRLAGAAR